MKEKKKCSKDEAEKKMKDSHVEEAMAILQLFSQITIECPKCNKNDKQKIL